MVLDRDILSHTHARTHTHTLTQSFNGLFYRTTWVGRYQKDKPFWILLKQRWWGGSGISWTICKSFALRSRQITTPAPHHCIFFTGQMPFLPPNQQSQKHWRTLFVKQMPSNCTCKSSIAYPINNENYMVRMPYWWLFPQKFTKFSLSGPIPMCLCRLRWNLVRRGNQ